MTKRTPDQIEADNELNAAVRKAAAAYGILNGGMLIDFMVIAEGLQPGDDDRDEHGILFMDNRCRTTVALGLLAKGDEMMSMQSILLDEEDDDGDG